LLLFPVGVTKIGRNDPCPCGSGKKYKRCCKPLRGGLDSETLARIQHQLSAKIERERRRLEDYGYVRPVISTTVKGCRIVAVGSTVYYSEKWKTVVDFLSYYAKEVLGGDWANREIETKPLEERHPILQLYNSWCRFQQRHKTVKSPGGLHHGEADGPAAAYLQLAYDLYVLGDHLKLQESLVARLKHPDQFQGARHELAVATHCIRAGFDIVHEDERDPTRQHPEFVATHKATGQVIAVEAKSRHRPGVLGFPGQPEESPKAGVRRVLQRALEKEIGLPYAVFVDLNLPPTEVDDVHDVPWLHELVAEVEGLPTGEDGKHPYNFLMFTNHPEHYGAEAANKPGSDRVSMFSRKPRFQVRHPKALTALHDAAYQYGCIPMWFEEEEEVVVP
jgi:uncharacterized protein YchJ